MHPLPSRSHRRARRVALALAVLGGTVAVTAPARAESPRTASEPLTVTALAAPSAALPGLPAMSIELSAVPVDSPAFRRAERDYSTVDATHTAAREQRADLDRSATLMQARLHALVASKAAADARVRGLASRLHNVERAIQALAVQSYVAGGSDERLNAAMASAQPAINEVERRDVLATASMDVLLAERTGYRARVDEAKARATTARAELRKVRAALDDIGTARPTAVVGEQRAGEAVATTRVAYEEARVLATVDGVEFPLVALDAYYRAAQAVVVDHPACGVQWWGLAGISRVEGQHGTYGGTTLISNGDTSRRIIGIPLNGTNDTQTVRDTDRGALDGDATFDRAVGPMQFIPQTWKRFQADGNGDGVDSPFNLYDATLAAASYLCTVSNGLGDDGGLRTAYFGYNHSVPYVDTVLGYAHLYERAVEVPTTA